MFDSAEIRRMRQGVRRWYRRHGRDLPWRGSGDPYRVWISEIMLQQTTVVTVMPYYERFLTRFPDVQTLAAATEEEVLRLWEGLGYYSRARNLHRTAIRLVTERDGRLPGTVEELQSLPGIGRYTAGAIVSFAYNRPAPIVEANTLRLYCRLLGYEADPRAAAGQRALWDLAGQLVSQQSPGEINQALMDLGATVCTPGDPDCSRCPLRGVCRAFLSGRVAEIPRQATRASVTAVVEAAIAIRRRGRYLLLQRQADERWAGLWDFPRLDWPADQIAESPESPAAHRQLQAAVQERFGIRLSALAWRKTLRHSVTRYRITLHCLVGTVMESPGVASRGRSERGKPRRLQWLRPADLAGYPLSVTGRQLAEMLTSDAT